ncbi:MAG: hypothetical protein IJ246_09885 [Clostridia bacterium]|nr:hypothetical protein [Clostridia bacterium]
MRRLIGLILFAAILCLTLAGAQAAVSYSERARYYLYITNRDTEMYAAQTTTDENGTSSLTLVSIGTLPGSTPVSSGDTIQDAYRQVTYLGQDGATHSVVIDKSAISGNYVTLEIGGTSIRVPKAASVNATFVSEYLNYRGISASQEDISKALTGYSSQITPAPTTEGDYYEENDSFTGVELPEGETPTPEPTAAPSETPAPTQSADATAAPKKNSTASQSKGAKVKATPKPTATPQPTPVPQNIYWRQENSALLPVSVISLGFGRSTISYQEKTYTVPTDDLIWNTNADADHRLAVIYAPKGGNANLRKSESKNSKILQKASGGRVVMVWDMQSSSAGVYYDENAGYLLHSVLQFHASTSDYQTGILTYEGSATSTKKINLYTTATESSRRLTRLLPGTPCTVLSQTSHWSEIDVEGWHGYVYNKFVTLTEETEVEAPDELLEEDTVDPTSAPEAALSTVAEEEEIEDTASVSASRPASATTVKPFYVGDYEMHSDPYN